MPTSTAKASPAPVAFYAECPYLIRLALACEESEDFLLSAAFLEAANGEEALGGTSNSMPRLPINTARAIPMKSGAPSLPETSAASWE